MNHQDTFFQLVRLGIGHDTDRFTGKIDWNNMEALAEKQGLLAIIVDAVAKLSEAIRPPKEMLLQWIGEVLQGYEYRFDTYRQAIAELAGFYNSHGYKMMVLKGYACGMNWPKPEHRPYGDIDIWQFGRQKEADVFVIKEKGINVDSSHHHHTVFNWGEFTIENHFDFIKVHHHKSNVELEKVFKSLGQDDTHYVDVSGERVYLPAANLHALFLIKHSMSDFTSSSVTLRQLLDWGFFVDNHRKDINWEWLLGILENYRMLDFFNTINALCVEELGFESNIFPEVQFNPYMKERVLKDILYPKYDREEPKWLLSRLAYKYKRWKGNAWKHELCYNESMWSAFWYGVWAKLLKPASI